MGVFKSENIFRGAAPNLGAHSAPRPSASLVLCPPPPPPVTSILDPPVVLVNKDPDRGCGWMLHHGAWADDVSECRDLRSITGQQQGSHMSLDREAAET